MLKDRPSSAILAVSDIGRARAFYGETLGLDLIEEMDEVLVFRTGSTSLVVYRSETAGTNLANAVVWDCGEEIEAIVADLAANGVAFEHYPDSESFRRDGDIHRAGTMRLVWLKDPDGNILHLNAM